MIGGYSRYDRSGYRQTCILTVADLEAEYSEHGTEFPISGDATLRWIGVAPRARNQTSSSSPTRRGTPRGDL